MKSILFLIVFIIAFTSASKTQNINFKYWIPYVDTLHYGSNGTFNYLSIYAFEDTHIQAGGNIMSLNAGDSIQIHRPLLREGLLIISDRQIEVYYFFFPYHWGIYEDGSLQYSVLEERYLGTEYVIPITCTEVAVMAIKDNTSICLDGQPYYLNAGHSIRFQSPPIGTEIKCNNPVSMVVANYASDHYSSVYAFQIYPLSMIGTTYFSPKQHSYNYQNSIDSTRIYLLAVDDETNLVIDNDSVALNKYECFIKPALDEVNVVSDKPLYAVYLNDIYGQDPWADVFRHYQFAFQLLPADFSNHEALIEPITPTSHGFPIVQVCVTSLADHNEITISSGESSEKVTLNYGERAYYHEGDLFHWSAQPLNIKSLDAFHATSTFRYWWNNIAETTFGRVISGKSNALYCSSFADPEEICLGDTCHLHANAFGGSGNLNYSWTSDPPGFASSLPDPSVVPLFTTVYQLEVTDENNAVCQSSFIVNVSPSINLEPEIEVCVYDSVTLDAGNEGAEYLWSNGSTARTITVGATGIGHEIQSYTVTVFSQEGCVVTIPCNVVFNFSDCTGIEDQRENSEFRMFPNPADRIVNCSASGGSVVNCQRVYISLYDVFGREVRTIIDEAKSPGEYSVRVDVSDLPPGIYLVRLQVGEQRVVRKLVVR